MSIVMWGYSLVFGKPWKKDNFAFGLAFLIVAPFAYRAWERHKIAKEMRHQREVRMEMKLNALLGLVSIDNDDEEES
jgi:hypothetical protein